MIRGDDLTLASNQFCKNAGWTERRLQVNDAGRTLAGVNLIKEMSDLYYLGSSKWRPSREFLRIISSLPTPSTPTTREGTFTAAILASDQLL